jgi:hypothetical protein
MPNSIGMAATQGTLCHGAIKFGGTWPFGVQCGGFPFLGDRSSFFTARPSAWSVGQAGGAGGLAARVLAHGFLLTRCCSLVHGNRLALLRAGNIESNPGPDGGSCVGCGLMPAANTRALLRCREGCGRECHRREACLRRGEQRQGIWACGMCVVVSGGVAPPQPKPLVNRDSLVRPNSTILRTRLLLWGVLCRQVRHSPAPPR